MTTTTDAARKLLADLCHTGWERRFLAAKRLASEAGRADFAALPAAARTRVTTALQKLLEDSDARVRAQSASALGSLGRVEAVDALLTALADPNEWVRVQVGESLGRIGNPAVAPLVARHLEAEGEPHVRATLVKALGRIGDEKILTVLVIYLEDVDNRVRANCVEAISGLKVAKRAVKDALLKVVDDPSNRVRANIAMGLLSIGELKGREILYQMVRSKDEFMRASAAYALGQVGDAKDRAAILPLLGDLSWLVRKNAIRALVNHGKAALEDVLRTLSSHDATVRLSCLEILGQIRSPNARKAVIDLLDDESGEVRSKAEEVLDLLDGN